MYDILVSRKVLKSISKMPELIQAKMACWYSEKGTVEIEVYYAGSRENALY